MCGIAGIVKWTRTERPASWEESLGRMSEALVHRGPDGAGMYVDPRPNVTAALVHRRLAIIDRAGGAQPMGNEEATVQVVFNGEIYNHIELRRELQAAGHRFRSDHSDTEVLVHGWEEWGTDLPAKLVGMFAFAIWDARDRGLIAGGKEDGTLFLARDRSGQKPLFYASLEDGLAFGSTLPSVLAWPEVPRRVPREQIGTYLLLGYFPGAQTVYRDVSQVLPGAWVRLRNDVLDGRVYWKGFGEPRETVGKKEDERELLRGVLEAAVESQLVADVPIACFLSGGMDSSIVAALMQHASKRTSGDAIQTVSVGFSESEFDETAFAAALAKNIGSRHTRLEVTAGQEVLATLRLLMGQSLGQPFADSSILPTYNLSRAAREIAPVALSGDGADEFFGGYDRYRAMIFLQRWGLAARLSPRTLPVGSPAKRERFRRLAAAARQMSASEKYTRLVEIFPHELAEELLGEPIMDWCPSAAELGLSPKISPVRLAMFRDQQEYLPGDVLHKVDAASMIGGVAAKGGALEVRAPFLDHRVMAFANGLDGRRLFAGGQGKRILRETFRTELPAEILYRRKKGFGVPVGTWFRGPLQGAVKELIFGGDSFTTTHLNRPVAERMWAEHLAETRDHTHRIFSLLMLELWWQTAGATLED